MATPKKFVLPKKTIISLVVILVVLVALAYIYRPKSTPTTSTQVEPIPAAAATDSTAVLEPMTSVPIAPSDTLIISLLLEIRHKIETIRWDEVAFQDSILQILNSMKVATKIETVFVKEPVVKHEETKTESKPKQKKAKQSYKW